MSLDVNIYREHSQGIQTPTEMIYFIQMTEFTNIKQIQVSSAHFLQTFKELKGPGMQIF